MNILVVGNGFDIAHGLPTKYTDFLDVVKIMRGINFDELPINEIISNINNEKIHPFFHDLYETFIASGTSDRKAMYNNLRKLIEGNPLIDYFIDYVTLQPEHSKWVDFEREISKIIQFSEEKAISKSMLEKTEQNRLILELIKCSVSLKYMPVSSPKDGYFITNIEKINLPQELLTYLENLILAFEIYVYIVEETYPISNISPDIKDINADFLISFNYTSTFQKMYKNFCNIAEASIGFYDYIHGRISAQNIKNETTNIVLGAPEHLLDGEKMKI